MLSTRRLSVAITSMKEHALRFVSIHRVSLFNHSCVPNVAIRSPITSACVAWIASRDIQAAEEVTVNYCDPDLPLAERRHRLKESYQFWCQCPKCTEEEQAMVHL